jgi:putative protein-disulfide isomerase
MILYYVHDPMCSWCWAYLPVLKQLRQSLPPGIEWRNLLGGLAPDSAEPMPEQTQTMVMNHWRRIQNELGTEFNFDFWSQCEPRRSTYIACRAALAAAEQDCEEEMILAIQQAYYLRAMNPSEVETLIELSIELNMDAVKFRADLLSDSVEEELQTQIKLSRSLPISGMPSLVLMLETGPVAIPVDYRDAQTSIFAITARTQV